MARTTTDKPILTEVTPGHLTTAVVANATGEITVVAETTATPGLLVAPIVGRDKGGASFIGGFNVVHRASGRFVQLHGNLTVQHARAVAAALAGPDWTRDQHDLVDDPQVRSHVVAVYTAPFVDHDD